MGVPQRAYRRSMDGLYAACVGLSATALVLITLAICYGVFMRYALNAAASWPEPFAVILMVMFSFLGGAAVYRANGHIAVTAVVVAVPPVLRSPLRWLADLAVAAAALFMLIYGAKLVSATWYQGLAEFPAFPVGLNYLPIPLAGLITFAFLLERLWLGPPPSDSISNLDRSTAAD
jgi:TRAP-type C4-dicarboxylate transport system permease small subunit